MVERDFPFASRILRPTQTQSVILVSKKKTQTTRSMSILNFPRFAPFLFPGFDNDLLWDSISFNALSTTWLHSHDYTHLPASSHGHRLARQPSFLVYMYKFGIYIYVYIYIYIYIYLYISTNPGSDLSMHYPRHRCAPLPAGSTRYFLSLWA